MQPHQFKGHGWWHSVNPYCILHGTLNQNPQILDTPHSEHPRFKLFAIGHYNKQLACNLTRETRPLSQRSGSSWGGIGRNRTSGTILRLKAKMPSVFSCGGSKSPLSKRRMMLLPNEGRGVVEVPLILPSFPQRLRLVVK